MRGEHGDHAGREAAVGDDVDARRAHHIHVAAPLAVDAGVVRDQADALAAALPADAYGVLGETVRAARFALSPGFAQAIYPSHFLCGNGACQACVADVAGGRRRVCLRGPVFDLTEIVRGDRE